MVEQLVEDSEEGVIVSGDKVDINLKDEGVYIIKYPDNYMKKEDFVWSIYTPKNCRAIELRFQNTGRNVSWLLIARQHNNEYINNISKRLEEMLAYGKKYAEERCKDDEEKATSEISKFCKEISGDTIMKILWGKEKFDKIYQMVVAQNKLEDDANIAYKELSEILKAEKLDIGLNALVH